MKKIFSIMAMTMFAITMVMAQSTSATASNWALDKSHSTVRFTVTHMMVSETEGIFKAFDGTIASPTADFQNAAITFNVDVNSVNTENADRDKHLKADDFFNAEKYPTMKFVSTSFKKKKGNKYVLEGNLTIRDVTKRVKFDVTYGGTVKDPWGNTKAGFKAVSTINRKDFGLKWNAALEAGGVAVSEDVQINLALEFNKAK